VLSPTAQCKFHQPLIITTVCGKLRSGICRWTALGGPKSAGGTPSLTNGIVNNANNGNRLCRAKRRQHMGRSNFRYQVNTRILALPSWYLFDQSR
jgi:hypothetical protein